MEKLMVLFHEQTDNEFSFLKLSSVGAYMRKATFDFTLLYPASAEKTVEENRARIENTLKKIIKSSATVNIRLKKSYFDFAFFKADLMAFLSRYPVIAHTLTDNDITVSEKDGMPVLTLSMPESIADYCETQNVRGAIEDFLFVSFCEPIGLQIVSDKPELTVAYAAPKESTFVLDRPQEGRLIRPQNVEDFIGRIIYEPAGYIEDASAPRESAVLCGTISKIYEQARKPKEGETEGRKFFKFTLEDFTGQMPCVYFPNQKTVEQFGLLIAGKQIVVRGKIEEDAYRGNGAKSCIVRDISLCTLPENFRPNRMRLRVPDEYKTVFPKPYVEETQASLFDSLAEKKETPPFLKDKTICVFDIETTGFNPDFDKIIEIGAVKMVGGVVTETFSTFIDPEEPLPERIIKLTHIEDADVKGQPHIDEVLPDFYKFTDGAILVGQNVQFDHGFISAKGAPLHMFFDNRLLDTLSLAKTYYPGLKNYKLETLVKAFGVVNKGAHRAIFDAWATLEVFLKLAEKLPANA